MEHTSALDPSVGTCVAIDERELYDLNGDPFQLSSTATQASSLLPPSELQIGLADRLSRLRTCAGIEGRDRHQEGQAVLRVIAVATCAARLEPRRRARDRRRRGRRPPGRLPARTSSW